MTAQAKDFNQSVTLSINPLRGAECPDYIREETLAEIFAATASTMGTNIALIEGERKMTYNQVDEESDMIARGLIAQGVGPGDVVGLYLPRGADLLIAQIAITKSGAAWLPFDAETPKALWLWHRSNKLQCGPLVFRHQMAAMLHLIL